MWQEILDDLTEEFLEDAKESTKPKIPHGAFRNERVLLQIFNNAETIKRLEDWLTEKDEINKEICWKDYERAEFCRQEGNKFYLTGVTGKALELYNDSIRHYPLPSVDADASSFKEGLSLAYANRSAVFFSLKEYSKCIADIELALKYKYPTRLKYKVLKRKAECLFELGQFQKAKEALTDAKKILCTPEMKVKGKAAILSSVDDLWTKLLNLDLDGKKIPVNGNGDVNVTYGCNAKLPNTSEGVILKYDATQGRHLVASRGFEPGDSVIAEKPFVSTVLQKLYKTHCRHCFVKADDMVPCLKCCVLTYCSENCRTEASKLSHFFECGHLVEWHEIGVAHLALRILLKTNPEELCRNHLIDIAKENNKNEDGSTLPYGVKTDGYSDEYEAIYHLAAHTQDMPDFDIVQYGLTASVLLVMLRRAEFFKRTLSVACQERISMEYGKHCQQIFKETKSSQKAINMIELFYGSLLCKHIHQIVCNGVAITGIHETETSASPVTTVEQIRLGTALYPVSSLLNHSCDPNCIQTFVGNQIVVKVTRQIKADEELTISYGPMHNKMRWEQRQQCLKYQYHFTCTCAKCKEGPQEDEFMSFKCQSCAEAIKDLDSGICQSCKKQFDKEWFHNLHIKSMTYTKKVLLAPEIALKAMKKCLRIQLKIFHKHNRSLASLQNAIACALAHQQKYLEAKVWFKNALEINKVIYGEESIEVGMALVTYTDLLMECIYDNFNECKMTRRRPDFQAIEECSDHVTRAIKIFMMLRGPAAEELTDLRDKEKYIIDFLRRK